MGHFARGTKRIDLGTRTVVVNGKDKGVSEWWEVKLKLSVGDRQRIQDELTNMRWTSSDAVDDKIYLMRGLGAVRKVATVNWQLFEDDGTPVPFERELIDELDPDDPIIELIDEVIGGLNLNPFGVKRESELPVSDTTDASSSTAKSKTAKADESS